MKKRNSRPNLKPRSDSVVYSLTPEQRDTLEGWLLDQNLGYRTVGQKCKDEFGVFVSYDCARRFYQKMFQKRTVDRIARSSQTANAVVKKFTDNPTDFYQAILKVLGQVAFDKAINSPEQLDVPTVRELTNILITARHAELDSQKFLLDREKWEFDVARTCFDHQAELQAIAADQSLDEHARLQAIRRNLFGENLPE